jgi:hypothetical protein
VHAGALPPSNLTRDREKEVFTPITGLETRLETRSLSL